MANKLANESSPYLQQHKNNPVDWYPYGEEAMELARKLDRPLFISIGYSTCHWCHVMARESFEDEETAKYMNENFVNIKIDREELPAIDKAYQEMFQILNRRSGGWPLSIYASHDGSPFFLGTYFPKKTSFGMRSFMDINKQVVKAWNEDREAIDQQATNLVRGLKSLGEYMSSAQGEITNEHFDTEIMGLQKSFDGKNGGLGGAPKFPRPPVLEFILQEGMLRQSPDLIGFVRFTFHKMAKGGLYDQIGGGFSRYSVDDEWLVPHFEKMLYDNAGLIELGAKLHAVTGDPFIKWVVQDTIAWLDREMKSPDGLFYSAQNAESEHREGAFYVWQKSELEDILGENYRIAELRYGITKRGNFDDPHHPEITGMNVLSLVNSMPKITEELKLSEDEVFLRLNDIRQKLFEVRWKREHPSTDTKIIVEWNALMIKALFTAAELMDFDEAGALAKLALDNIVKNQIINGTLYRLYESDNSEYNNREIEGVLSDYSFVISACIAAFEYTDDWKYIQTAKSLLDKTISDFYDPDRNVFYLNTSSEKHLLGRVLEPGDNALRSGLGVMIENLFKLGKYIENKEIVEMGLKIAQSFAGRINDFPGAMSSVLMNSRYYFRYPTEIVVVGDDYKLMNAHMKKYIPQRLVYRWNETTKDDGRPFWETLEARDTVDQPTVFICEGMTCSLPLTDENSVMEELNRIQPS